MLNLNILYLNNIDIDCPRPYWEDLSERVRSVVKRSNEVLTKQVEDLKIKISEDVKAYEDKIKILTSANEDEKLKSDELTKKLNAEVEAHKKSSAEITALKQVQAKDKKAITDAATKLKAAEEEVKKTDEGIKAKDIEIGRLGDLVIQKDKAILDQKTDYENKIKVLGDQVTTAQNDSKAKQAVIDQHVIDLNLKDTKIGELGKQVNDITTQMNALQQNGG